MLCREVLPALLGCSLALGCSGSTGPEPRVLPEGNYTIERPLFYVVPPVASHPGGASCVRLVESRIVVDAAGAVSLIRRFIRDPSVPSTSHETTVAGEQHPIPGSAAMELRFGAVSDTAILQHEPGRDAVYARQHFPATSSCPAESLMLEYVRQ